MRYYIYIFLIQILCIQAAEAQDMKLRLKYEDGVAFLRWTPHNAVAWESGIKTGYVIEKYENNQLVYQSEKAILPAPWSDSNIDYAAEMQVPSMLIYKLTHFDMVDEEDREATYPSAEYSEDRIRNERFEALEYYISYDFHFIDIAGLGYVDNEIKDGVNYRYVVKQVGADHSNPKYSASVEFNSSTYETPALPKPTPEWSDRRVVISWNTLEPLEDYWGYRVTISQDGGPAILRDSTPLINLYQNSDDLDLQIIDLTEILIDNETEYTFKIYAFDYFGHVSKSYEEVKGTGRIGIGLSPTIIESKQLKTNEVKLRWKLLEKFNKHIGKWHIYVSENYDGPYELDTTLLDTDARKTVRPIPFPSCYFIVSVEDDQGKESESFPQLVMSLDTIAPAIPINLLGAIDTSGIVTINWDKNYESDFLGYKVFFANDTTDTWGLPHKGHLQEPEYLDTINLRTIQEQIFFKITAVDLRNNRSEFSEILVLERPDILPPVEPHFTAAYSMPGKIDLRWNPSISEDVVKQSLYRREMREKGWNEIKTWKDSVDTYFIDSLLVPDRKYVYLLRVEDDAGLMSVPSEPITGIALVDHSDFPKDNFDVTQINNKQIEISYNFPNKDIFEVWIYKKTEGADTRILRKLEPPKSSFIDKNIKEEESYSYFIQIVFLDGIKSEYSISKTPSRL